jgi:hypothetical protein
MVSTFTSRLETHLKPEHMLIKTPREVSIQKEAIGDSFANNASHESEIAEVIWVDAAV